MALAAEQRGDLVDARARGSASARRSVSARGRRFAHDPGGRSLAAQRVIDEAGDARRGRPSRRSDARGPSPSARRPPDGGAVSMSARISMAAATRAAGVMRPFSAGGRETQNDERFGRSAVGKPGRRARLARASSSGVGRCCRRRSLRPGRRGRGAAAARGARQRPAPYDWDASPPTASREAFVAWMAKNRGEDANFSASATTATSSWSPARISGTPPTTRAYLMTPREEFVTARQPRARLRGAFPRHRLRRDDHGPAQRLRG